MWLSQSPLSNSEPVQLLRFDYVVEGKEMKSKDATGLSRGTSRLELQVMSRKQTDATALRRGGSRSELNGNKRETPRGQRVSKSLARDIFRLFGRQALDY